MWIINLKLELLICKLINFKELGAKSVLGLDISTHMIEMANTYNKLRNINYKVVPMEDIDKINYKFDIVISSLAFHYVIVFYNNINLAKISSLIFIPVSEVLINKDILREQEL